MVWPLHPICIIIKIHNENFLLHFAIVAFSRASMQTYNCKQKSYGAKEITVFSPWVWWWWSSLFHQSKQDMPCNTDDELTFLNSGNCNPLSLHVAFSTTFPWWLCGFYLISLSAHTTSCEGWCHGMLKNRRKVLKINFNYVF